jgi:hypothetical protein
MDGVEAVTSVASIPFETRKSLIFFVLPSIDA